MEKRMEGGGEKRSISGAAIKNIAYVTMLIDHFFASVYWTMTECFFPEGDEQWLLGIYRAGRAVGRMAFVLFAFMIAEGFCYTKNRSRYCMQMAVFALLSEIPFDLALSGVWYEPKSQNVYFTLFLGVAALCLMEHMTGKVLRLGILAAACVLAAVLRTDYMFMGVLLIAVFYFLRGRYLWQVISGTVVLYAGIVAVYLVRYLGQGYTLAACAKSGLREMYGAAAFLLLAFYHGKKGRRLPKIAAYAFYPVHLLLLYGLKMLLKGI